MQNERFKKKTKNSENKKKSTMFRSDELSELSGVWWKELSESDEKRKKISEAFRVFLTAIVLVLFLQKVQKEMCPRHQKLKKKSRSSPRMTAKNEPRK